MIETRDLTKTFLVHRKAPGLRGSLRSLVRRRMVAREAVRHVSLDVHEGEIVGLIGANGAGKTTLVKMLAGIVHPTSGQARVLGFDPYRRDDRMRRQISLIMGQKAQLWWDLPAADCFLLLKEIYRIPEARYRETLEYLAALLDVTDELEIQIRRLSLGERMKMELIAALLHWPRVVFLDEPTIGLDLTAQRSIRDFLLQYRREHQPAMIVTSHYMEDIERLCERILVLRHGELVYDGSVEKIIERYARHKHLTVHFRLPTDQVLRDPSFPPAGEILESNADCIRLVVPRPEVASAAAALLERYPVVDLSIEEQDLGTIIEQILRDRSEAPA